MSTTARIYLNCLGKKAAINSDVRAGNETAGFVAGQKDGRADQFARFAEAGHWRVPPNGPGAGRGRSILVKKQFAILFSGEKTGSDGVDPNVFWSRFSR